MLLPMHDCNCCCCRHFHFTCSHTHADTHTLTHSEPIRRSVSLVTHCAPFPFPTFTKTTKNPHACHGRASERVNERELNSNWKPVFQRHPLTHCLLEDSEKQRVELVRPGRVAHSSSKRLQATHTDTHTQTLAHTYASQRARERTTTTTSAWHPRCQRVRESLCFAGCWLARSALRAQPV